MKLTLENVTVRYSDENFCYNAEITSPITGVIGRSGSGKTTLFNAIAGLIRPESGTITYNGKNLFCSTSGADVPVNRRKIGVVFQENFLFPHMTVRDNLLYGKRFSKDRPVIMTLDTVTGLLDLEGLLHRKPFQLSGGERQRVAIGRALLSQPELILMDEPFSNLDRNRRREIISYLLEINRQYSLPLLVISHDIEDVLKLTSSLVIIDEGRITASGSHDAVADDEDAHDVIGYSAYTNIIDLLCTGTSDNGTLLACTPPNSKAGILMKTGRPKTGNTDPVNRMVRFQLSPNDIVLSSSMLPGMSIQNQLKGTITRMHRESGSCFVHADCGIKLVAEITEATYNRMDIRPGADIYCLIKAKALQTIHVF